MPLNASSRKNQTGQTSFKEIPRRYIQLLHRLLVKADSAELVGQHQSLLHAAHQVELLRLLARAIVAVALLETGHVRSKQLGALGKVVQRKAALLGGLGRALPVAAVLHDRVVVRCEPGEIIA